MGFSSGWNFGRKWQMLLASLIICRCVSWYYHWGPMLTFLRTDFSWLKSSCSDSICWRHQSAGWSSSSSESYPSSPSICQTSSLFKSARWGFWDFHCLQSLQSPTSFLGCITLYPCSSRMTCKPLVSLHQPCVGDHQADVMGSTSPGLVTLSHADYLKVWWYLTWQELYHLGWHSFSWQYVIPSQSCCGKRSCQKPN